MKNSSQLGSGGVECKNSVNAVKEEPIILETWNAFIDQLMQSERKELALVWIQVILLDKLQLVYSSQHKEDGTIEMQTETNGNSDMPVQPASIIAKNEASDNPRPVPRAYGNTVDQNEKDNILTKDKCPVIVPTEDEFESPDPKPYPILGSKVSQEIDTTNYDDCPNFQKEFDLYNAGKLQLNFLYLFWGKHLGTFFHNMACDLTRYYRSYGRNIFKTALVHMISSLGIQKDALTAEQIECDMDTLEQWLTML